MKTDHHKQEIDIAHKKKLVRQIVKTINGNNYTFGFVVAGGTDQSVLGQAIYSDPELDVDVAIIIAGDGISFRAKQDCDLDLSKLAKRFRGGGHHKASGCQISGIIGKELIDLVSEHMRFEDENS